MEKELGLASGMMRLESFVSSYWYFVLCFWMCHAGELVLLRVLTGLLVNSGVSSLG
jgi:hypothetical protein